MASVRVRVCDGVCAVHKGSASSSELAWQNPPWPPAARESGNYYHYHLSLAAPWTVHTSRTCHHLHRLPHLNSPPPPRPPPLLPRLLHLFRNIFSHQIPPSATIPASEPHHHDKPLPPPSAVLDVTSRPAPLLTPRPLRTPPLHPPTHTATPCTSKRAPTYLTPTATLRQSLMAPAPSASSSPFLPPPRRLYHLRFPPRLLLRASLRGSSIRLLTRG